MSSAGALRLRGAFGACVVLEQGCEAAFVRHTDTLGGRGLRVLLGDGVSLQVLLALSALGLGEARFQPIIGRYWLNN